MSIELMTRVWKTAPVGGSELLVLLALADFGNDDGSAIYPSIKTIAGKARLSDDQTRRIIHKLITLGLIELVEAGGWDGNRNRSNEYRIIMQPPCMDASTGTRADASTVPAQMQGGYSRGHRGGTRADASTGTSMDATTVPAPVQDDPSLEPPLQPSEEPPLESSSSSDEEETDAAGVLWREVCNEPVPESIRGKLNALIAECGSEAVAHGIRASIVARSRNFSYIAQCARNYVPPATNGNGKSYQVDLPGVYALPPAPRPQPAPLPAAMPHSDPWAVCLGELKFALPGGFFAMLAGSTCEAAGVVPDGNGHPVPLYRIAITHAQAAHGLSHFTHQAGPAIRRKLGSVLGKPVQIEIVAAEMAVSA